MCITLKRKQHAVKYYNDIFADLIIYCTVCLNFEYNYNLHKDDGLWDVLHTVCNDPMQEKSLRVLYKVSTNHAFSY
jgi:delta-aminolevulinic acid dehydratase/porphobilinogen synthase